MYFKLFCIICEFWQKNKTPLSLATNGGEFYETVLILLTSVLTPIQIWFHGHLQMPLGYQWDNFSGKNTLGRHNSDRICQNQQHEPDTRAAASVTASVASAGAFAGPYKFRYASFWTWIQKTSQKMYLYNVNNPWATGWLGDSNIVLVVAWLSR